MPSIIQDIGLVEAVLSDVTSFASGTAVSTQIDGYDVSIKVLTGGPVAPYEPITGSFFQILELAFADYEAFVAGAPISIAEKIGNTWYGTQFSKPVTVAPSATVAPKIEV